MGFRTRASGTERRGLVIGRNQIKWSGGWTNGVNCTPAAFTFNESYQTVSPGATGFSTALGSITSAGGVIELETGNYFFGGLAFNLNSDKGNVLVKAAEGATVSIYTTGDMFRINRDADFTVGLRGVTLYGIGSPVSTIRWGTLLLHDTNIIGRSPFTVSGDTSPTTTTFETTLRPPNDFYNGETIHFDRDTATAALRGQSYTVSDIVNDVGVWTVSTMAAAPQAGDTFHLKSGSDGIEQSDFVAAHDVRTEWWGGEVAYFGSGNTKHNIYSHSNKYEVWAMYSHSSNYSIALKSIGSNVLLHGDCHLATTNRTWEQINANRAGGVGVGNYNEDNLSLVLFDNFASSKVWSQPGFRCTFIRIRNSENNLASTDSTANCMQAQARRSYQGDQYVLDQGGFGFIIETKVDDSTGFGVGNTIVGQTRNKSGVITSIPDGTTIRTAVATTGLFQLDEVVVDQTSAASATVTTKSIPVITSSTVLADSFWTDRKGGYTAPSRANTPLPIWQLSSPTFVNIRNDELLVSKPGLIGSAGTHPTWNNTLSFPAILDRNQNIVLPNAWFEGFSIWIDNIIITSAFADYDKYSYLDGQGSPWLVTPAARNELARFYEDDVLQTNLPADDGGPYTPASTFYTPD